MSATLESKLASGKGCIGRDDRAELEAMDSNMRRAVMATARELRYLLDPAKDARYARHVSNGAPELWPVWVLQRYVGGLSNPSKMPGLALGLPAGECGVGSRLRSVEGSTCQHCYAYMRGNYRWVGVLMAQYARLEALDSPLWVRAMVALIERTGTDFFRWHDSGDLQSVEHFARICAVARRTPNVAHWIPTREYRIVAEYRKAGRPIPSNLTVRMSAHSIGGHAPTFAKPLTVSTVSRAASDYPGAHHCPAPSQDNECGSCRACWSRDVSLVTYHIH